MIPCEPKPPAPMPEPKKDVKSLVKTIAIIALSLLSLTFIGLFIWMFTQYDAARTDVDGQISDAVVKAIDDNTMKLENEFAERRKMLFHIFNEHILKRISVKTFEHKFTVFYKYNFFHIIPLF